MLWCCLFYIGAVCTCVYGIIRFKFLANPLTLFSGLWGFILTLYQLRLSKLQRPLSEDTYLLLTIMILFFAVGFFLFYSFIKKERKVFSVKAERTVPFSVIRMLFIVWLVVSACEVIYSGGVPLLWTLTDSSKTYFDFGIPSVHGLFAALGLVIILLSCQRIIKPKDDCNTIYYYLIIATMLLFYLVVLSRQVIMSAVIEMAALYVLVNKRIPWIKVICISLFIVFAFGIVGNLRSGYGLFLKAAEIETNLPSYLSGFYWVYMYLTMTIANINNMLAVGLDQLGIYPIIEKLVPSVLSEFILPEPTITNPSYLVKINFTVSGFVSSYYEGFGLLGVAFGSALFGSVSGYFYRKQRELPTERNMILYSVVVEIITLSFFTDMLLYLPNGFQLIIILVIYGLLDNAKVREFLKLSD